MKTYLIQTLVKKQFKEFIMKAETRKEVIARVHSLDVDEFKIKLINKKRLKQLRLDFGA